MRALKLSAIGVCLALAAPATAAPITYAFSTDAGYGGQFSYDAESGVSSISFQAPIRAGGSLLLDVSGSYENQPALVPNTDAVLGAPRGYRPGDGFYNPLAHHLTGPSQKFWADGTLVRSYESAAVRLSYNDGSVLVLGDGSLAPGLTGADIWDAASTVSFMVDSVDPYSLAIVRNNPTALCPVTLDFALCPDSVFPYWDTYITTYPIVSLQQIREPPLIAMLLVAMSIALVQSLRSARGL